jgi:hypothetical protein
MTGQHRQEQDRQNRTHGRIGQVKEDRQNQDSLNRKGRMDGQKKVSRTR